MYIIEWRDENNDGGWHDIGVDAYHDNLFDAEERARKERELVPECWVRIVRRVSQWKEGK